MITIPANSRYLNYKIQVDNFPENPVLPDEYILEFPHTYGSNRAFKNVFTEVFKSADFTGSIAAEFFTHVRDAENNNYEKPALMQQADSPQIIVSALDQSTDGTYKLIDNTAERLIIRVSQVTPGTGRIIFSIRGL